MYKAKQILEEKNEFVIYLDKLFATSKKRKTLYIIRKNKVSKNADTYFNDIDSYIHKLPQNSVDLHIYIYRIRELI